MEDVPAVVTLGTRQVQHRISQVWAELRSGAIVQVVDRKVGRRKAYIVPVLEPGYEPQRIGCEEFTRKIGAVFDQVRDGEVFEVFDHEAGQVRGYVQLCPPDSVARLDVVLQFASRKTPAGRVPLKDIRPLEVTARS